MSLTLRAGGATDVGRVREANEDALLIGDGVWIVADGMGGHAAGEVASGMAIELVERQLRSDEPPGRVDSVVDAVADANSAIFDAGEDDPAKRGMGTTVCVAALVEGDDQGPHLGLVHVGDSRIYRLSGGELSQLTTDHKMVQELVDRGEIAPDEAHDHPMRNVLTRALGIERDVAIDAATVAPVEGDRFLMCSDGLYDEVDDGRIAAALRRLAAPDEAAAELVRMANTSGGHDNITVIVLDVVDDDGRLDTATSIVAADPLPSAAPTEGAGGAVSTRPGPTSVAGTPPGEPPADGAAARHDHDPAFDGGSRRDLRALVRPALFVATIAIAVGVAVGGIAWYANNSWFVGFDGDTVTIFQGRPGGVLWIDPDAVEATELTRDDVPAARISDLEAGKVHASRADAERYVDQICEETASLLPSPDEPSGEEDSVGGSGTEATTSTQGQATGGAVEPGEGRTCGRAAPPDSR
ncbi:MAG TPA: Stp1/IreP family PP2C-type Ser/Thr phosphatase [Acidimicrobiales bacterium]